MTALEVTSLDVSPCSTKSSIRGFVLDDEKCPFVLAKPLDWRRNSRHLLLIIVEGNNMACSLGSPYFDTIAFAKASILR